MSFGVKGRSPVIELLLTAELVLAGAPAFATETHRFDIPVEEAPAAIKVFASQAQVQILVAGENVKDKHLHAVSGDYSTEQGLQLLLADSGLTPQYVGDRSIALVSTTAAAKEEPKAERSFVDRFRVAQADTPKPAGPAAVAGSDSADNKGPTNDMAEVVVSALKRNTKLQATPIAISAVTGDRLEKAGNPAITQLTR